MWVNSSLLRRRFAVKEQKLGLKMFHWKTFSPQIAIHIAPGIVDGLFWSSILAHMGVSDWRRGGCPVCAVWLPTPFLEMLCQALWRKSAIPLAAVITKIRRGSKLWQQGKDRQQIPLHHGQHEQITYSAKISSRMNKLEEREGKSCRRSCCRLALCTVCTDPAPATRNRKNPQVTAPFIAFRSNAGT